MFLPHPFVMETTGAVPGYCVDSVWLVCLGAALPVRFADAIVPARAPNRGSPGLLGCRLNVTNYRTLS